MLRERERDRERYVLPCASVSFLFIYSPCLFFLISRITPPPLHLQHSIALPSFNSAPPPSFSSLLFPGEKRFCLLLVSAPSQSAFLISSYCFCLIFKCYPGPNGNPYNKKRRRARERGKERAKEKPAGYCVSLQDPETKEIGRASCRERV